MRASLYFFRYAVVLLLALHSWSVSGAELSLQGLNLQGQWIQGGLLQGRVQPTDSVEFMGRKVRVAGNGLFVIGLGRDAPKQVELVVRDSAGIDTRHEFSVEQREYNEQIINGVPQRTVTPPAEVLERIRHEVELVKKARAGDDHRQDFLAGFRRPLEGKISGVYGSRRVYNGTPGRPHYGLDIAAPMGEPVYAPAAGMVKLVHDDMYYSGGTLIVDHGHGLSSTFIHLSKILVKDGERVESGDPIAEVGAGGRATGPHLDWRINWFDVRIDPALVLDNFPVTDLP